MKKTAIVIALLGAASVARAGAVAVSPVAVDLVSRLASGSIADTRATSAPGAFLLVRNFSGGAILMAKDSSGNSASCVTSDPELIALARTVVGDSFVAFSFDATGTCRNISVTQDSFHAPKVL